MSLRMIKDVLAARDIATHCPLCGRSFARVSSTEEHIFPRWMQHHHGLWTRRLTLPNFVGKTYKGVKIRVCEACNNQRYGQLETALSPLLRSADPYGALAEVPAEDLAVWLGKIFWLLCRKSHSVEDFRTRDEPEKDRVLPDSMMPGVLYLGMIQRAFATGKGMLSCHLGDPPYPPLFGVPYSLYRFRIDTRDNRFEAFDFFDNVPVLGAAIRCANVGLVCIFDGGLHRTFRAAHFGFLRAEALHPMQFNEVVGRMFFDQTVLDDRALQVTYYWNAELRSVLAMTHTPRQYNPYLEANNDPRRYAEMVGRYTFNDPDEMMTADGRMFTCLTDNNGAFLPYAVTEEEIEAARMDPTRVFRGPIDASRRQKPPRERP